MNGPRHGDDDGTAPDHGSFEDIGYKILDQSTIDAHDLLAIDAIGG
ncbi:hypothetical protein [Amycolatopsis sp. cmx-4-54]